MYGVKMKYYLIMLFMMATMVSAGQFTKQSVTDFQLSQVGDTILWSWNDGNSFVELRGGFWYDGELYSISQAQSFGVDVSLHKNTEKKWGVEVNLDAVAEPLKSNIISNGYSFVVRAEDWSDEMLPSSWEIHDKKLWVYYDVYIDFEDYTYGVDWNIWNQTTVYAWNFTVADPSIASTEKSLGAYNYTFLNGTTVDANESKTGIYWSYPYNLTRNITTYNASLNFTCIGDCNGTVITTTFPLDDPALMGLSLFRGTGGYDYMNNLNWTVRSIAMSNLNHTNYFYRNGTTNFDTDDKILMPGDGSVQFASAISSDEFSVCTRFRLDTDRGTDADLFECDDGMKIQERGGGLRCVFYGTTTNAVDSAGGLIAYDGTWHTACCTKNNESQRLLGYLDGALVLNGSSTGVYTTWDNTVQIASNGVFEGAVDWVAMLNDHLTHPEGISWTDGTYGYYTESSSSQSNNTVQGEGNIVQGKWELPPGNKLVSFEFPYATSVSATTTTTTTTTTIGCSGTENCIIDCSTNPVIHQNYSSDTYNITTNGSGWMKWVGNAIAPRKTIENCQTEGLI